MFFSPTIFHLKSAIPIYVSGFLLKIEKLNILWFFKYKNNYCRGLAIGTTVEDQFSILFKDDSFRTQTRCILNSARG